MKTRKEQISDASIEFAERDREDFVSGATWADDNADPNRHTAKKYLDKLADTLQHDMEYAKAHDGRETMAEYLEVLKMVKEAKRNITLASAQLAMIKKKEGV